MASLGIMAPILSYSRRAACVLLLAGGAACGDEAVKTTHDTAADVLFVPPDTVASDATAADSATGGTDADTATPDDTVTPADTVTSADTSVAPDTTVAPDSSPADTTVADTAVAPDTSQPKAGESCDNAVALADGDGDHHFDALGSVGATSGLADDYDATACGETSASTTGAGQRDEVWRFVAPTSGEYVVSALADTNIDVILYVFADGACGSECKDFDDSGGVADIDELRLTLAAGDVIDVVVDGKASAHAGSYLVDVYDCGGTCATP
ncbi:MAG: hypothetical protein U1F43_29530 [Myxococcota bacterium]